MDEVCLVKVIAVKDMLVSMMKSGSLAQGGEDNSVQLFGVDKSSVHEGNYILQAAGNADFRSVKEIVTSI